MSTIHDVYNTPRNGANHYLRHTFNRKFLFTDGANEFFSAGFCYWLLDLLALEAGPVFLKAWEAGEAGMGVVEIVSDGSTARISITGADDAPPLWSKETATDLVAGKWNLYLAADESEGSRVLVLILPSEY